MPNLPKAAAALLDARFARLTSRVLRVQRSGGGDATKCLIELQDGAQVESVVMHYDSSSKICCSLFCGCVVVLLCGRRAHQTKQNKH